MEGIWLRMRKRDRISLNGKEREKGGQAGRPTGGVRKLRVNGVCASASVAAFAFGPRLVHRLNSSHPSVRPSGRKKRGEGGGVSFDQPHRCSVDGRGGRRLLSNGSTVRP